MFEKMCDKNYLRYTNNQLVTNCKKPPIRPSFDICLNSLNWLTTPIRYSYYVEFT